MNLSREREREVESYDKEGKEGKEVTREGKARR